MKKTNRKRIFGIFSIFDIIILCLFIVFLIVCYFMMRGGNDNQINKTITYTLKVEQIQENFLDDIKVGDTLYDVRNNNTVGEIISVETEKSYVYLYNFEKEKYSKNELKDKYDIYVEIKSDVYETERNLLIGNLDIKSGIYISVKAKNYSLYGKVINIVR